MSMLYRRRHVRAGPLTVPVYAVGSTIVSTLPNFVDEASPIEILTYCYYMELNIGTVFGLLSVAVRTRPFQGRNQSYDR